LVTISFKNSRYICNELSGFLYLKFFVYYFASNPSYFQSTFLNRHLGYRGYSSFLYRP
jgi:hypothetical protein